MKSYQLNLLQGRDGSERTSCECDVYRCFIQKDKDENQKDPTVHIHILTDTYGDMDKEITIARDQVACAFCIIKNFNITQ